jgi:hypothetical protein
MEKDARKPKRQAIRKQEKAESSKSVSAVGWGVDRNHVYPVHDLRDHKLTNCWCKPTEDDGLMLHKSLDGREYFERGDRKPS